ncbi:MAG: hypothetical protein RL226_2399 [Bacteroidota bacterium]
MKKIYAVALVSLISAGASAQLAAPMAKEKSRDFRGTNQAYVPSAEREVFYTNTFSNCADWSIDNALSNGFNQFVDLQFECGVGLTCGGFAPIDAINSTTASDGYMMVDSDEYGGEEGGTGIENCWFQMVNPVDCSEHPFVSVSFLNQYRMWDGGASDGNEYCLVEVSRDGVTWPDVTTFEVADGFVDFGDGDGPVQARWEVWPEMETQDPVNNPTEAAFDITAAAGGQSQIWLRFRWKGTWGYAWFVDDVAFFDTEENDLRIDDYVTVTDYFGTNMYGYTTWPTSHATEVQMAAETKNIGYAEQTNVILTCDVDGSSYTSDPYTIGYTGFDTLRVAGFTIPSTVGVYDVTFTVTADAEDANTADNVATRSFEVTEYQYGRDDKTYVGFFPASTYTDNWIAAVPYQFFGDATIYAIDVALVDGDPDAPLIASLRSFDDLDAIVSTSQELELNPAFLNDGTDGDVTWYTFVLEDPITVTDGEGYIAAFESYGGSGVRMGESIYTEDQTAFVFGDFGSAGFDWYFTNETPMIRLNMDPNATNTPNSVEENTNVNFNLFQNMPNPSEGVTRIRYNMNVAGSATLTVTDITGKVVMVQDFGQKAAGQHVYELNTDQFAAGMYSYTLTVGGETATRKMMVK